MTIYKVVAYVDGIARDCGGYQDESLAWMMVAMFKSQGIDANVVKDRV